MLLCTGVVAHAEHFEYKVDLEGSYSDGGVEGCFPPGFDQPACPHDGRLSALMSFDTPTSGDGAFLIAGTWGDITNFQVSLYPLVGETLYGGVNVNQGQPNGIVQTLDQSETFIFDWSTRSASFRYDFGDHNPNGSFVGVLSSVPEPGSSTLLLAGLAALGWTRQRRATTRRS